MTLGQRRQELQFWARPLLDLVICVCVGLCGCEDSSHVYPDAPFNRVSDSFPHVIPLQSEPSYNDDEAYNAYWAAIEDVFDHSMERSILRDATETEREAFLASAKERYVRARVLAEELLQDDPLSIVGLFVMANVEAYAEADLPYALSAIRQARSQAEQMGQRNPDDPIGQEWYLRILEVEFDILSSLDRSEDAIEVIERIESVYAPVPWMKAWPMMKLDRYDEAQAAIDACLDIGEFEVDARNTLAAMYDRMWKTDLYHEEISRLCDKFPESQVLHYNLGLSHAYRGEFARAERALLTSTEGVDDAFDGTPYTPLACLLTQQGRFAEAFDALGQAKLERGGRDVYTLQQDEAYQNSAISSLLVALSEPDLALKFAKQAADQPDRSGSSSMDEHTPILSSAWILWTAQKLKREQLAEQIAIRGGLEYRQELATLTSSMWRTRQHFQRELDEALVAELIPPFHSGSIGLEVGIQSWHRFQLLDLIPLGILEVALNRLIEQEPDSIIQPYLSGMQSAVRLRRGLPSESLRSATNALDSIPATNQKLFRAHIAAVAGEAAWQLGESTKAIDYWTITLRDFPQAFRLLELRLPIRLETSSNAQHQAIADLIRRSPRFTEHPQGCRVVIRDFQGSVLIEMFRNNQARHVEVLSSPESSEMSFADLCSQFHHRFFQPLVELSQTDLGSLDGSPVAARLQEDVDDLFREFAPESTP